MKAVKLNIILPVYFEEKNIVLVLAGINKYVKTPHEITLVFQDKKDPTIPIAQKLEKKYNNLKIIVSPYGLGIVSALKYGFKHLKEEIVTVMMSDLSDDPRDVDKMVAKIDEGYDLVCASRYSARGARNGGPVLKGILSRLAGQTIRYFGKLPTSDPTNAFKTYRKKVVKTIKIESIEGFELPLELVVKSFKKGYKITEVPTVWEERKSGKSKFKILELVPHYMRWYVYAFV